MLSENYKHRIQQLSGIVLEEKKGVSNNKETEDEIMLPELNMSFEDLKKYLKNVYNLKLEK